MSTEKIKLGVTCGDLHGVGMEVALKAISELSEGVEVVLYAPAESLNMYPIKGYVDFEVADLGALSHTIELGKSTTESAHWAIRSIDAATNAVLQGAVDAIVTAPIDKYAISNAGFSFPGHTEYLAERAKASSYLMTLMSGNLRVGTITGHVPVAQVASCLTHDMIVKKTEVFCHSLTRDHGLHEHRIALLGLNPHAGDNGRIGSEEISIIRPAIDELRDRGVSVEGPFSADGFFGSKEYQQFDGILSMYHDQGLIPFKLLSFGAGVNFTAGLSFVRTSPDHGTAFDIAGEGRADHGSFLAAMLAAERIVRTRRDHES